MKTEVIYEDGDILVVRKPAGLAVQTARTERQDVVSELKNYLSQPYLGIIHRLDQPVEGLLVFAKNRDAAAKLSAQLKKQGEGGLLHKRYYALICGKPGRSEGRYVDYLYKNDKNAAVVTDAADAVKSFGGKRAALSYRILQETGSPAELALAEIILETGRFHQIRAQMAYHGFPLLGDMKYGDGRTEDLSRRLGVKNVALCACGLTFAHPASKEKMSFSVKPQNRIFSLFSQI